MFSCDKCGKIGFTRPVDKAIHEKYCDGKGTKLDKKKRGEVEHKFGQLCKYGCGQQVVYKDRCNKSWNKCPVLVSRNSNGVRTAYKKGIVKHYTKESRERQGWSRGLTKETDERVKNISETYSKNVKDGKTIPSSRGRKLSDEHKKRISIRQTLNHKGGRCKWYEVAGQKVQGTWERDIALKLNELNIKWIKLKTNKDIIEYAVNGKIRRYTPDFFLSDYNLYLEIKGYWWGNDKEKMRIVLETCKDKKIKIIQEQEYKQILSGDLSSLTLR